MTLIDEAARKCDQADLAILAIVETIRDQREPATASAVASLIGGAPVSKVSQRLARLNHYGIVDVTLVGGRSWQLTPLGAELMMREMIGWSPSQREMRRRDYELTLASGAWRN